MQVVLSTVAPHRAAVPHDACASPLRVRAPCNVDAHREQPGVPRRSAHAACPCYGLRMFRCSGWCFRCCVVGLGLSVAQDCLPQRLHRAEPIWHRADFCRPAHAAGARLRTPSLAIPVRGRYDGALWPPSSRPRNSGLVARARAGRFLGSLLWALRLIVDALVREAFGATVGHDRLLAPCAVFVACSTWSIGSGSVVSACFRFTLRSTRVVIAQLTVAPVGGSGNYDWGHCSGSVGWPLADADRSRGSGGLARAARGLGPGAPDGARLDPRPLPSRSAFLR